MGTVLLSPLFASAAALSGVLAHLVIWVHGEWDSRIGHILMGALLIHITLTLSLQFFVGMTLLKCFLTALCFGGLHTIGTFSSIVLYRIIFHRLCCFPGPVGAKVWIWDIFLRTWRSGHRQSIVLDKLHAEFGPVVRYAPDRLSVNLAAAVPLVHGSGSTSACTKSVVYLNPVNGGSINADRSVESHHARRKLWERALSSRALPSYVPALVQHTAALISSLQSEAGRTVNVNKSVQLFTFDVMGTVGFGRPGGFNGLTTGKLNKAAATLIDMMSIGVYMMLVPWLHVLLDYVPTMGIIYKPDELFRDFAKETLGQYCNRYGAEHSKSKDPTFSLPDKSPKVVSRPAFKDVLSQIHPNSDPEDRRLLSDCVLLAIAGADTTTSSIVHILYRLSRHPDIQKQLHDELCAAGGFLCAAGASEQAEFAHWVEHARLPLLEAFIKEVLRLHPPAPTGLPRLAPAEGLTIQLASGEAVFIPGHTNISVPVYTLLRDPKNFKQPLDFLPQRFLPVSHPEARPDLVLDSRAYIPFLQGPYGCAGKQFAYLEMKVVLAGLVGSFEIGFPDGTDVEVVNRVVDTQWRDYSTVKAAPLALCFLSRSGSADKA